MNCYLCGHERATEIKVGVRNDDDLTVVECVGCGLQSIPKLRQRNPDDLTHYYQSQDYREEREDHEGDIEARFERDKDFAERRVADVERSIGKLLDGLMVMDVGAGSGAFVWQLTKTGAKEVMAIEPSDLDWEFISDIPGVLVDSSIDELSHNTWGGRFDVITLFHVIEHLQDPIELLSRVKEFLTDDGVIIVETPNLDDVLLWYGVEDYRDQWYQNAHIFYFNHSTLYELCRMSGLVPFKLHENRTYVQRYGLANHIQWLMGWNKPGQESLSFIRQDTEESYARGLIKFGRSDTLWFALKKGDRKS